MTAIGGGYHVLTNRFSGLALDVSGASTAAYAPVDTWTYIDVPNEEWSILPA